MNIIIIVLLGLILIVSRDLAAEAMTGQASRIQYVEEE